MLEPEETRFSERFSVRHGVVDWNWLITNKLQADYDKLKKIVYIAVLAGHKFTICKIFHYITVLWH